MELIVGLFKTNSCVAGSYVAVVSSPLRCVPKGRETKNICIQSTPYRIHSYKAKMNDDSATAGT